MTKKKKKPNNKEEYIGLEKNKDLQQELISNSDRASAIVGAIALEIHLERLLEAYFVDDKSATKELLGEGLKPLSGFSAKIRISYCLGLISKDEYKDIMDIKDIRNAFAHHVNDCTFKEETIKKYIENFRIINKMMHKDHFDVKQKFVIQIGFLDNILRERIRQAMKEKRIVKWEMNING